MQTLKNINSEIHSSLKKITGILLIAGSVLVNVPYILLISNFQYPDILREPTGTVLTKFAEGGSGLVFTWLFFALAGVPLLVAVILLRTVWAHKSQALLSLATTFGIIGFVAQMIGLLRWVFVVPVLVQNYAAPGASDMTKEAYIATFQAVHQFGGVLLGEYVGQLFTIGWMLLISVLIIRSRMYKAWIAWLGIVASCVYILAQTELIHTVVPTFPSIDIAGLIGSMLWLIWMICLGVLLIRKGKVV